MPLCVPPARWTSRWSASTCWCRRRTSRSTSSSKPTSASAWPITSRSRPPSASSTCSFRSASLAAATRPASAGRRPSIEGQPTGAHHAVSIHFIGWLQGRRQREVSMTAQLPEPDLNYMQRVLEMLAIPSPTGFTDTIVRYVAERLTELGIPFELTRRGTIRATPHGSPLQPGPRGRRAPGHHRRHRPRDSRYRPLGPGAGGLLVEPLRRGQSRQRFHRYRVIRGSVPCRCWPPGTLSTPRWTRLRSAGTTSNCA